MRGPTCIALADRPETCARCQTNDPLLTVMLHAHCDPADAVTEKIVFAHPGPGPPRAVESSPTPCILCMGNR
jgi:hypothetical protein